MNCVFCDIVSGKASSLKVYEDEYTLILMAIANDVDSHMLAIPKKHVESILDCDKATLNHLMSAVKKVAEHCVNECGYEGVNLLNASGESAGQSIPHFHIHIIPRKRSDNIDAWPKFDGANCSIEEKYKRLRMN